MKNEKGLLKLRKLVYNYFHWEILIDSESHCNIFRKSGKWG